jgi:predicted pyridoxine 5'-phosphate oxidase superfamily flavin-nucleotide-binding protein
MQEPMDKWEQAARMIERAGHILLATVDEMGTPRLTPVEECAPAGEGRLAVRAWLDIPPMENRGGSSRMALLVWDERDLGFQLTGHAVAETDTAVLDGLAEIEEQTHFPQVERDILMQVEFIEDFRFLHMPLAQD